MRGLSSGDGGRVLRAQPRSVFPVPDLPAPASPSQGGPQSLAQLILDSGLTGETVGTGNRENYLKYPFIENGEFKTRGNALNFLMATFVKDINSIL